MARTQRGTRGEGHRLLPTTGSALDPATFRFTNDELAETLAWARDELEAQGDDA
jgi:hypothetical protein